MLIWFKEIFSGFIVGIANIIPGVSGGTLLFLLGLYERTINAINNVKPSALLTLFRGSRGKTRVSGLRRNTFMDEANVLGFPFLARLLIGAGTAILLLSGLMKYMLDRHFSNTFAFFFGLIAVSTVLSIKMLNKVKPFLIVHFLIGAAVTVGVAAAVNPAVNAQKKSDYYESIVKDNGKSGQASTKSINNKGSATVVSTKKNASGSAASSRRFEYAGRYTPKEMAFGALAGAIAISAMILPGLSGSLVLILLGQYYEVISAISGLKSLQLDYFAFLTAVGLGMLFGILAFARVIKFVFERFYNGTIAVLIGLTAGSLYALWPFKKFVTMDLYEKGAEGIALVKGAVVQTNANILPPDTHLILPALLFCGLGVGIMLVLDRYGAEKT
jgi:putative membrane protein